jgi:hypothetical protein
MKNVFCNYLRTFPTNTDLRNPGNDILHQTRTGSGTAHSPLNSGSRNHYIHGRAIAEAVSRWLPTAAAPVRVRAEHVGFVVDKVALGQVFSEYFGFLRQSSFRQFLDHYNHSGLAQ